MSKRVMLRPTAMEHSIHPYSKSQIHERQKFVAFADDLVLMVEAESIGKQKTSPTFN